MFILWLSWYPVFRKCWSFLFGRLKWGEGPYDLETQGTFLLQKLIYGSFFLLSWNYCPYACYKNRGSVYMRCYCAYMLYLVLAYVTVLYLVLVWWCVLILQSAFIAFEMCTLSVKLWSIYLLFRKKKCWSFGWTGVVINSTKKKTNYSGSKPL